jgi:hypothetical protein
LKNQDDFKEYRRSISNPGLWKNKDGNFRRAPSRSPSTPKKMTTRQIR